MLFAARVDIDVYDASGNIVHIAGKSEFPMLRRKRQYKHRKGDDCVTSIFSDASKIGTVNIDIFRCIENRHSPNVRILCIPPFIVSDKSPLNHVLARSMSCLEKENGRTSPFLL
ncbi:hypothetical protein AVEN_260129-1 [Araneus ventricosus]|uniref:Uncharacterized protein n=1 Tax=Araneus ventricosus TaxID=182803 RepID=A0A4Y2DGM5_ARAVE|nr:hypothetical protein AVEN_260129-1 [Araneus ventricosus]